MVALSQHSEKKDYCWTYHCFLELERIKGVLVDSLGLVMRDRWTDTRCLANTVFMVIIVVAAFLKEVLAVVVIIVLVRRILQRRSTSNRRLAVLAPVCAGRNMIFVVFVVTHNDDNECSF